MSLSRSNRIQVSKNRVQQKFLYKTTSKKLFLELIFHLFQYQLLTLKIKKKLNKTDQM